MRVVFFDFGNVLATYDHRRSCDELAAYTTMSSADIFTRLFASQFEELHYNVGEYSDEEWYQMCVEMLHLRNCPYDVFAEKWGAIFSQNPAIEPVLATLRQEVGRFVVSNTNGLHWRWIRRHISVLSTYFPNETQHVLSYEVGSRKPEHRIYEAALERAGVLPEEALLIDDKEENILAFERLGGRGIVYSAEASIEGLQTELRSNGLVV